MKRRKVIRKTNRPLNIFNNGGSLLQKSTNQLSNAFNKDNLVGTIGSVGTSVGTMVNTGISNSNIADTSKLESMIDKSKSYIPSATNNDTLMTEWGAYSPLEEVSWRDIRGQSKGQLAGNTIGAIGSGVSSGAMVGGPIGAVVGGLAGLGSSLAGIFTGNKKAKRKANELNKNINIANERSLTSLEDRATNIDTQTDLNMLANYSAYGGYLNKYNNGGNLNSSIPNIGQHGGDFSNGVTLIGNGGTHEDNPISGVPMGVDQQGVPNLVEEGEVKYNDYMFSNRIIAEKNILSESKLPTKYNNHSFAKIAESLNKESSERPNDPISKNGLASSMSKLQQAQEIMRNNKNKKQSKSNIFNDGGPLSSLGGFSLPKPNGVSNSIGRLDIPNISPLADTTIDNEDGISGLASYLRYVPVVGSGLNVITDLAGITNKPDHTNSDIIGNAVNNLKEVEFNPIGNYLTHKPLDRDFYTNKLNAQSGATRRSIENQSGGNRATATAGLLAADYNAQGRLGDLARQSEEYNQAQKERVEGFNRQTNMFNSEMGLRADSINKQNDELRFRAKAMQAQMRDQTDMKSSLGKSANLTNLFNNLGNVGREEYAKNTVNSLDTEYYSRDSTGKIKYKNKFSKLSKPRQDKIRKEANSKIKE